jgi:rod shape-determining protein MreC
VFFVFLLLEVVSIALIVRNNNYHRGSVLSSSNRLVGNIYELNTNITDYFKLKSVNEDLALENAALRALLKESNYAVPTGKGEVKDSVTRQHYTFIPAKVINNSTDRQNNYLTINRGILQGVEPEMAVISPNGIVGIVKDVSKNYASVISVLHKRSSISAKLPDSGYIGSLVWDGKDARIAQLNDIPNHVNLAQGMMVQTSGYSAMFPAGINIGKVKSFEVEDGANFYSIEVDLLTDMRTLSAVYVVDNLMRMEQIQLEEQTETDE